MNDFQRGKTNYEKNYIKKTSISTLDSRLWDDFTNISWISEYLYHPIHVWNKINGHIIIKVEQENESTPLNLIYGNNHFELAYIYSQITNIPI